MKIKLMKIELPYYIYDNQHLALALQHMLTYRC